MKRNATVVRGGLAGVVAATALAVFFLVVDTVEGRPLYTPAFLASVLAGLGEVEIGFGLIAMYTALHYAVFILIGMGVVWLLHRTETGASYLLGIVLGFLLFDVIFYAGVLITGVDVVRELGWPELMSGNLIAGLVLMGYLRSSGLEPTVSWRTVLRQHRIIREGLIAGALGAGAVALWFLVLDVILGRIFFTPAALGSALFFGARRAADIQITGATVLGYTVVHVAAFLLTGFVAAALATEAERDPPLLLGFALLFVTFETLFIGLLAILAGWLLNSLPWWTVAVANLIAAVVMGAYLWREHPALRSELREHRLEDIVDCPE